MKHFTAGACFLALALGISWAQQNRLPQEEAQRYARPCADQAALLGEVQIKTDVDPERPCAERGEGGGAMVIPDRQLSEQALLRAGKDVTPVGQLWLRKWTVVVSGKATPKDMLRLVTVKLDDQARPMPFFLLGMRHKTEKDLELVVYAKDSEPLLSVPVNKAEFGQSLPLELEWKRGEREVATLTLNILGKYQTVLPVTGLAD